MEIPQILHDAVRSGMSQHNAQDLFELYKEEYEEHSEDYALNNLEVAISDLEED
tara:strand:+ start:907 stop:1068 length:162 start_codon:yes stop_codon:yes gene_type:complete